MGDCSQKSCRQYKKLTPEDVVSMKRLNNGGGISPDGKWISYVVGSPVLENEKSEYINHIWISSTDGKIQYQLTNGPNGDSDPQWSPDSSQIAFVSKRSGDKSQIYVINITRGEARQLTYVKEDAANPVWSPDGTKIAFVKNEEDDKHKKKRKKAKDDAITVDKDDFKQKHLRVIDVNVLDEEPELIFSIPENNDNKNENKDKSKEITRGNYSVFDPRWSPDSKQIAFAHAETSKPDDYMFRSTIHIVNLETKELRKLTKHEGYESTPRWSRDGKWIAYLYKANPDDLLQRDIYVIPSKGGKSINLTSNFDQNKILPLWSPRGNKVFFEAVEGVRFNLYSVSLKNGSITKITEGDHTARFMSLADDDDTFAFHCESPEKPKDVWIGSIASGETRHLTNLNPQISDFPLGKTYIVDWPSKDGTNVQGLLRLPVDYKEHTKYPLIVSPHGGPYGAVTFRFNPHHHFFSAKGFAVFEPNFRGSEGYGSEFGKGNYENWGVADYQDIMSGIDYLIENRDADPDKLVVEGWSYGGYLTNWLVAQTDRFKAASSGAGLSNLVSMYAQNDIPTYLRQFFTGLSPYESIEIYLKHSPITYIKQVKTPTLLLHGAEDKRVPPPQAEEFYRALKTLGVDVEYVKYPREGHSINEPRHILDLIKRQVKWFKKYI
ncbi:prolyl oligopeptidase family serine peptidase [Candidatus Poribacteria bacterium]|nr:prolyl oligopeptidase family serine peptidase [Candidatus Poribacteria bacterium]